MTDTTKKVLPDVTGLTDEQILAQFGQETLDAVKTAREKTATVQTADQTEVGTAL